MLNDAIRNYLLNREEFYSALLPRIPHEALRTMLQAAVEPTSFIQELLAQAPNGQASSDFLAALELHDALKKTGFGAVYGRTVISFEEALARSESIEKVGALLFEQAADSTHVSAFSQEAQRRRLTLAAVLYLGDNLRYRKS